MRLHEAIESGKPFRRESWNLPVDKTILRWIIFVLEDRGGRVKYEIPYWDNYEKGDDQYEFDKDEICATDWILKYDCETCKATKEVKQYLNDMEIMPLPCPDCSTPKYKCNTCKDTGNVLAGCVKEGIVTSSWEQTCPICKGISTPKYKCNTCKDTKEVFDKEKSGGTRLWVTKPCLDCSPMTEFKYKCNTCHDTGFIDGPIFIRTGVGPEHSKEPCPDCSTSKKSKDEPPKMKKITVYRPIFDIDGDLVSDYDNCLYKDKTFYRIGGSHYSSDLQADVIVFGWEPVEIEVLDKGESK